MTLSPHQKCINLLTVIRSESSREYLNFVFVREYLIFVFVREYLNFVFVREYLNFVFVREYLNFVFVKSWSIYQQTQITIDS